MPPRIVRTRAGKPRPKAKRSRGSRPRVFREDELQKELEGLYALDARISSRAITSPSSARWLRRAALVAPVAVAVQAFVVFGIPFFAKLWNRPEFLVFRFGE